MLENSLFLEVSYLFIQIYAINNLDEWKLISPEAKDLLTRLLTYDPAKRISADECLQHAWIKTASANDNVSTVVAKNVL